MPRSENRARVLMCAIGLLLTVVEVSGFGFDFANDTVGFGLICVAAAQLAAGSVHPWWLVAAVSAGLAAVVSLFTYGGVVGQLMPYTYRLWTAMSYLDTVATAGVVVGLTLAAWRHTETQGGRLGRSLPLVAGIYVVAAGLQLFLSGSESAYYGTLGHVRQAVVVITGLLQVLAVVVTFLAAGSKADEPDPDDRGNHGLTP